MRLKWHIYTLPKQMSRILHVVFLANQPNQQYADMHDFFCSKMNCHRLPFSQMSVMF